MRADFLLSVLDFLEDERAGRAKECAERIRVVSADPLVSELRIAKSPAEIEAIAEAAAQADRAMQAAVDACKPGVTEADVAWVTEQAFRLDGAERVEFTLIAAGANAAQPHHHSGQKVLQKGEGIIIDIGASLNGYKSDITRVVFLGNPDKEFLAAYDTVRKANEAGKRTVRPGVTAQDVDRATRRVIDNAGLGDYFIHRTGHGLGLDVHESPWIQEGSEKILQPGMVFSVEPGVYIQGGYGIRVEDIVTVTEKGVRTLTGFDHELVIKEI
jgi:Xaa-Pro aminopeptidase